MYLYILLKTEISIHLQMKTASELYASLTIGRSTVYN